MHDTEKNDHVATRHKTLTFQIRNLNAASRYTLYIVPVCVVLAIPVAISFLRDSSLSETAPRSAIAEIEEKRFWIIPEALWLGCWLCVGISHVLPWLISKCTPIIHKCGSTTDQYNHAKLTDESRYVTLARQLRGLIALVFWVLFSQVAFAVIINHNVSWKQGLRSIISALLLCCCITLLKQLIVHCISISCYKRKRSEQQEENRTQIVMKYYCVSQKCGSKQAPPCERHTQDFESFLAKQDEDSVIELLSRPDIQEAFSTQLPSSSIKSIANDICRMQMHRQKSQTDVMQAIKDLSLLLNFVVVIICCIVLIMFLSPNFVGAIATSATALLSLSFMFATTCQEVLGSCVFLFAKHPYDVGDCVVIDHTEYLVDSVALLYTVFARRDNHRKVQTPNVVLNGLWIDNLTRSKVTKLSMTLLVPSNTNIRLLQQYLQDHLKDGDKQPTVHICNIGFTDTKTIQLTCEVEYKSTETANSSYATLYSTASLDVLEKLQNLGVYKDKDVEKIPGERALHLQ